MSPADRPAGPNWYDVLDVDPAASTDEVRAAWRASIADLTPADRRFRLYNQAAEVLLDPERRAAYDAELAAAAEADAPHADDAVQTGRADREVEEHPATEPTRAKPSAGRSGRVPAVPTWLIIAVALLTAVAVGVTGFLWTQAQPSEAAVTEAASTARSAAERAVEPVLAYDWETLEQDREAAHEVITSDYREKYDQLFEVIEENAPSTRTVVEVEVIASAISRVNEDGNRVSVLLFVNRPTTNRVTKEPVVYKDQVTLTMQRVEGEWLVDDVQTSPAQQ